MSATPSDHLASFRAGLKWHVTHAESLAETHRTLAHQYAYDATVKHHVHTGEENRTEEKKALNLAFWHDGVRNEIEAKGRMLACFEVLLDAYEESLKTERLAPAPAAPSPDSNPVEF